MRKLQGIGTQRKCRQRGATLVEIIGSFVLLGIMLGGIIQLSEASLHNATYAKQQLEAIAIAKEKIGLFKQQLLTNPGTTLQAETISKGVSFEVEYQLSSFGTYDQSPRSTASKPYYVAVEAIVYDYDYTSGANAPKAKKASVVVTWE